jgi:hypothetical protein
MKGLNHLPTGTDLLKAYNFLQAANIHYSKKLEESQLIEWCHWSRFDPRLGELLVTFLKNYWDQLNLMELRKLNLTSTWPQTLGVILYHLKLISKSIPEAVILPESVNHFVALITADIKMAPYQSYLIGVYKFAGKEQKNRADISSSVFSKWGFYESDLFFEKNLFIKLRKNKNTYINIATRKNILSQLLKQKKQITVADYIEACGHAIHPRQAERDLKSFFKLNRRGQTRNRVYSR